MIKKVSIVSLILVFSLSLCSFAGTDYHSSNTIMPKNQNVGPDMGMAAPKQTTSNQTQSNANESKTNDSQAPQLTAEQLAQLQMFQAMQAAQANQAAQATQAAQMQALANAMLDIPSGFTSTGFAYGLARLAHNLSLKRGEVDFVSAAKVKDKQYLVVCKSRDYYANGTFLVDIFPSNENELKDGYQIWFTLYDPQAKKIGTAQAKKMHN